MRTFFEWIAAAGTTHANLESAVREYMKSNPAAKRCYYVTRPKNVNFDPSNPKHLEDELGPGYDKGLDVIPFKHHPQSFTCVNVAEGLAKFLREKGFKARKVAGWYGKAEPGYSAGHSPSLDYSPPTPPRGMRNAQEHWWVEAEGYYIDITSAQFHPTSPQNQEDLVIRDKYDASFTGEYAPFRRFPLGRSVRLPPNAQRMVDKILSLKKFSGGMSSVPSDLEGLSEWIERNAPKYAMSKANAEDIVMALRASKIHFADRRALERLFGDAFDEIKEDEELRKQDAEAKDFKPEPRPGSRGTVRMDYGGRISLNTVSGHDVADNFEKMKEILGGEFSDENRSSSNNYGTVTHKMSAKTSLERIADETRKKLKDVGFKVDI
jgi:hypothetical protein